MDACVRLTSLRCDTVGIRQKGRYLACGPPSHVLLIRMQVDVSEVHGTFSPCWRADRAPGRPLEGSVEGSLRHVLLHAYAHTGSI